LRPDPVTVAGAFLQPRGESRLNEQGERGEGDQERHDPTEHPGRSDQQQHRPGSTSGYGQRRKAQDPAGLSV
jgi:hypothetical protein